MLVNIVHDNREDHTVLSLIKTLLDGTSAKAEEALKDKFAIDLLGQHIRDAERGLSAAKETLATMILRQRSEQTGLDIIEKRIADLELRTRSALTANDEKLAQAGAGAIAELENEREVRRATLRTLGERAASMRLAIEKAHRRIIDLNQGLIAARAIEGGRGAQRKLDRSIGRSASLHAAEALLRRITERSDPFEESAVLDEIDAGLNHDAIRDTLEAAGHGAPTKVRASDVLARLKNAA